MQIMAAGMIDEESALHANPQSSPRLEDGRGVLISTPSIPLPMHYPGGGLQQSQQSQQQQQQHILPSTRASITIKNNNNNNKQQQQKPPPKLLHP
jgi:hypothetical protein